MPKPLKSANARRSWIHEPVIKETIIESYIIVID
jgi:hypothetical protein